MKVKELIKLLEKEHQEKEVCVIEECYGEMEYFAVEYLEEKYDQYYESNNGAFTESIIVIQ